MFICYCDESGNDGMLIKNGKRQEVTPLFVLTTLYFHQEKWKAQYQNFYGFRRSLNKDYGFPVKMEFHTLPFLKNKFPYRDLNFSDDQRFDIFLQMLRFISTMEFSTINVAINKSKILSTENKIVEWGFGYSLQRIENAISELNPQEKFAIISDPGRIANMRAICRKMQKINFIPSMFSASSYRQEISMMIEDVLEKNSRESYFIQIADTISFVISQYLHFSLGVGTLPKRIPLRLDQKVIHDAIDLIKPILNTKASSRNPYGIVIHPL